MRRRSSPRANGGCGLPVAERVCRTAESSVEMMESSHLGRRPRAVFLQEAVAEKVRRQPGGKAKVQGARGAGPTCVSWCSRRTPAPLSPRNKGCAQPRRRDPGCRPRLSHRALKPDSAAPCAPPRAVPHLAAGPRRACPRPLLLASPESYVTREESPACRHSAPQPRAGWARWAFLTGQTD